MAMLLLQVLAARKRIKLANKSAAELEMAKEADALGPSGQSRPQHDGMGLTAPHAWPDGPKRGSLWSGMASGCLACMKRRCGWVSCIDRPGVQLRLEAISDELVLVRDNPMQEVFER